MLHDIFAMPFEQVATAVGRTAPSCQQLAKRARQRIAAQQRFDVPRSEHHDVTEKFIAACASGDLDGLLAVLAPNAWGGLDLGPGVSWPVVTGTEHVAANLLRFWGPRATLVSAPVGDRPALLGFIGQDLAGVLILTVTAQAIESVQVIGDPLKLRFIQAQLS